MWWLALFSAANFSIPIECPVVANLMHGFKDELWIRYLDLDLVKFIEENADSKIYVIPNNDKIWWKTFRNVGNFSCEHSSQNSSGGKFTIDSKKQFACKSHDSIRKLGGRSEISTVIELINNSNLGFKNIKIFKLWIKFCYEFCNYIFKLNKVYRLIWNFFDFLTWWEICS